MEDIVDGSNVAWIEPTGDLKLIFVNGILYVPVHMSTNMATRLSDEADQCRNDGADDIAKLLDEAAANDRAQAAEIARLRKALQRLESAVDWYLGRSAFTQTTNLKGMGHSEAVRKELYAAHDESRTALSELRAAGGEG